MAGSAHAPVPLIGLGARGPTRLGLEPALATAHLLADAQWVPWRGTATPRRGQASTRTVCCAERWRSRPGLASSYTSDVGARIVERCAEAGVEVACETYMSMADGAALGTSMPGWRWGGPWRESI